MRHTFPPSSASGTLRPPCTASARSTRPVLRTQPLLYSLNSSHFGSYRRSLTGARCAATNTHPTMAEEAHEVEKILQKRTYYRKPQYLVKWKGYPLSEATW